MWPKITLTSLSSLNHNTGDQDLLRLPLSVLFFCHLMYLCCFEIVKHEGLQHLHSISGSLVHSTPFQSWIPTDFQKEKTQLGCVFALCDWICVYLPAEATESRDYRVCMCVLSCLVTSVTCCDTNSKTKEGASVIMSREYNSK